MGDVYILSVKETLPGFLIPKEELGDVQFWIQMYGIPPLWHREEVVRFIGNLVGRVIEVDAKVRRASPKSLMFLRGRVEINTLEKLIRGTTVELDGLPVPIAFKYERLFNFCYWCGLVDYVLVNCEETLKPGFDIAKCEYGDWLRGIPPRPTPWDSSPWKPVLPRGTVQPRSFGNPFAQSGQTVPPGFRIMSEKQDPRVLPPPVKPALPSPVTATPEQFSFQAQALDKARKVYRRTGKGSSSSARKVDKEADGNSDHTAGKRRRGGGSDRSELRDALD